MSYDKLYPPTGNEGFDNLRELQILADAIHNPMLKREFIEEGIQSIPTEDLFDQPAHVASATVFGSLETEDKTRRFIFSDGMRFFGKAAAYNYFYNPSQLIDCVTVTFVEPTVVEPEVIAADFELFTFQVPVLAVDYLETPV